MPSTRSLPFAAAVLWGICVASPILADEPPRTTDLVETSQVDVVEAWPFVVRAKKKSHEAHCRALGPAALRVTEDGVEVLVLSVTQAPSLSTHVLLVDTSSSMTDPNKVISRRRGRQAKAAGRAYVNWMLDAAASAPAGPHPDLMLLTFDDDLIMRVPPTAIDNSQAAADVIDSIRRITGGYLTGLLLARNNRPARPPVRVERSVRGADA